MDELKLKLQSGCQCQRKTGGRKNKRKNACWTCCSESHMKSGCPKLKCFKCGEVGHKMKRCPKNKRQSEDTHVNKGGITNSEEKKACVPVVTNQKEQEMGDVSDIARQKRHGKFSGNARMIRSAVLPNEDIERHS